MAYFIETQQYESSSGSNDEMEIDQQTVQKKTVPRRSIDWIEDKKFSDDASAQMAIQQEEHWSRYYTNRVHDGIKVHYRCNKTKFRGKQCNAAIYLYYPHDNDQVILFRTKNDHNHTNTNQRYFFSKELKQNIKELFDLQLKPKKIYEMLEEKNF